MLLRVQFENHKSIKDKQELSLVASRLKDDRGHVFEANNDIRALPAAVVYGANASGKSNIVDAIRILRRLALFGNFREDPEMRTERSAFVLSKDVRALPSAFEIDFIAEGIRYQYGFSVSDTRFETEYLKSFPFGKTRTLLRREGANFEFGSNLRGQNKVISELTRPDCSFLSTAFRSNHKDLMPIFIFLINIQIMAEINVSPSRINRAFQNDEIDPRVINFLSEVGTGVIDYKKVTLESSNFEPGLRLLQSLPTSEIRLTHAGDEAGDHSIQLSDESSGTRRLLILLTLAFAAIDRGSLLVVDEIDASLHTQVCEEVLQFFSTPELNPKRAQLICTTHDTNFLISEHLRRDQIWFTEKTVTGATELYPLSDFHIRKTDNLEKGYLEGRFGAIPLSVSLRDLITMTEKAP